IGDSPEIHELLDRITSVATFATRATTDGAAQSYLVLQNSDGVQLLITYRGATDDVAQVGFSPGGLYTPQGFTNPTHLFKPTATDEITIHGAKTVVGTSITEDRLTHVWCASDGSGWRTAIYGSSAQRSVMHCEKITRIAPTSTFPVPYLGGTHSRLSRVVNQSDFPGLCPMQFGGAAYQTLGTVNSWGFFARVFTAAVSRSVRMFAQTYIGSTSSTLSTPEYSGQPATLMASTNCASMGGAGILCWPLNLAGETTANLDGPWATMIDWFQGVTTSASSPGLTDQLPGYEVGDVPNVSPPSPRTNWWVALGAAAMWPWKNAAATMEII
ncbi:MAG: hypothetical protein AAB834_00555, partial [Patescibacteria group bacterium]